MAFKNELEFEGALAALLTTKGWEEEILYNLTEKDLIKNWANILFDNNREIDKLNNQSLTEGEMNQILEQITNLRTPLRLNSFINGKTVSIIRDNSNDLLHFGKEVSLKIYDRMEIAGGKSRYQIVRQPRFEKKSKILNNRRGDLMLLINGMPLIHIELKNRGIPVIQACNQIEKYSNEGVFTGLFSLVQLFVAMTPDETLYFANPGVDGKFNSDYYFNWADFDNEAINDYKDIASQVLSIPMAHKLIGFYTVADNSDGVLKVMRSYQYYASSAISDKVSNINWDSNNNQLGGFVWHTTGSGKTMTSFKSAQLIANSKDADKVVFLTDRIELGVQSLKEYRGFAQKADSVQATENTNVLTTKLKSNDSADTLIVTSIQKMSNINNEDNVNIEDIEAINKKRIVFIVDEAHRSTFGDMLRVIKDTFDDAIFFGFTGTPIQEENQKKSNTTSTIFGDELHRYSIADGIRDKNVLGFDPYKILTFKDSDVRKSVALDKVKAHSEEEAIGDLKKSEVYYKYMNAKTVKMYGEYGDDGKYIKGIEDYLAKGQYLTYEHQNTVVEDISDNWITLSHNSKFHSIFATSSIPEAITYYRLLKIKKPDLKITCLFDPNIDNNGDGKYKADGLVEIIGDYNDRYNQNFTLSNYDKLKKDIALRLAHKEHYKIIDKNPDLQIDLLIVVDQMLTGFDSKWINTLYMDKILEYANIIQAFSRTNRLFGPDKPFGTIRYYRKPHTMEQNIEKAVKLYSGDKPVALFVEKLNTNLEQINQVYENIVELFNNAGEANLDKLPSEKTEKAKFAKLFRELNLYLEASLIQGFRWDKRIYTFINNDTKVEFEVEIYIDKTTYLVLAQRYKELSSSGTGGSGGEEDIPYELVGYLTQINTDTIDADYMNSRFDKYLKLIKQDDVSKDLIEQALNELHKTFATLTKEEQKHAEIFLHDVQRGNVSVESGKTLRDYITYYQYKSKNEQIHKCATKLGLDEGKLRNVMSLGLTDANIDEFGRFKDLKDSVDKNKVKEYFEKKEGNRLIPPKVIIKLDKLLREFIISGGFDI